MEDLEGIAWRNAKEEDLWIFDKLIVSRKLGYICGPAGVEVPYPGWYIVRPCVNIPGMSRGATFDWLEKDTHHIDAGYFWCEVFTGDHVSVDYKDGKQVLAVKGTKDPERLYRFIKWEKINDLIPIPLPFYSLIKKYEYVNIEYIGGKAIEIHLRHNPDFIHGNSVAYPVWNDSTEEEIDTFVSNSDKPLKYIQAQDYLRKGFWID